VHGTAELPEALATMACHAAQRRLDITIGYELPAQETAAVEAYLASNGDASARQRLLSDNVWRTPFQDGRTSRGVFGLIETARQLAQSGAHIHFVATDSIEHADRERFMAERLAEARQARPRDLMLVAGGMNHMWSHGSPPGAGNHLEANGIHVVSLKATANGGTQWQCSGGKCVYDYPDVPVDEGATAHVRLPSALGQPLFDGELYLGRVHAAEPAAEPPAGGWKMM
jgi:hypothetical protein